MLRIYDVILETLRALRPTMETIEKRDPDLGKQLRRAIGRTQSTKPLFDS